MSELLRAVCVETETGISTRGQTRPLLAIRSCLHFPQVVSQSVVSRPPRPDCRARTAAPDLPGERNTDTLPSYRMWLRVTFRGQIDVGETQRSRYSALHRSAGWCALQSVSSKLARRISAAWLRCDQKNCMTGARAPQNSPCRRTSFVPIDADVHRFRLASTQRRPQLHGPALSAANTCLPSLGMALVAKHLLTIRRPACHAGNGIYVHVPNSVGGRCVLRISASLGGRLYAHFQKVLCPARTNASPSCLFRGPRYWFTWQCAPLRQSCFPGCQA